MAHAVCAHIDGAKSGILHFDTVLGIVLVKTIRSNKYLLHIWIYSITRFIICNVLSANFSIYDKVPGQQRRASQLSSEKPIFNTKCVFRQESYRTYH